MGDSLADKSHCLKVGHDIDELHLHDLERRNGNSELLSLRNILGCVAVNSQTNSKSDKNDIDSTAFEHGFHSFSEALRVRQMGMLGELNVPEVNLIVLDASHAQFVLNPVLLNPRALHIHEKA